MTKQELIQPMSKPVEQSIDVPSVQTFPKMVQDRQTGEYYDPQERFEAIMNEPEVVAILKRLKFR